MASASRARSGNCGRQRHRELRTPQRRRRGVRYRRFIVQEMIRKFTFPFQGSDGHPLRLTTSTPPRRLRLHSSSASLRSAVVLPRPPPLHIEIGLRRGGRTTSGFEGVRSVRGRRAANGRHRPPWRALALVAKSARQLQLVGVPWNEPMHSALRIVKSSYRSAWAVYHGRSRGERKVPVPIYGECKATCRVSYWIIRSW